MNNIAWAISGVSSWDDIDDIIVSSKGNIAFFSTSRSLLSLIKIILELN